MELIGRNAPRRTVGGVLAALLSAGPARAASRERLVVYYADAEPASALAAYDHAVLDGEHHPPLAPLAARGTRTYGYLSAGEAERGRGYFAAARDAGVLLDENPNWPGSHHVDVRRPEWRALVLDRLVPALLEQGFEGIFLDTLDNPPFLEARDPRRFAGMTGAAADLVREMRQRFPDARLMLNRAYEIHGQVGDVLDGVLAEGVYGGYDFAEKQYRPRSAEDARWQLDRLAELRRHSPAVRVFTLDYWAPDDHAGVRHLYAQQRRNGFVPYVATIDLHRIVPEPGR